MLEAKNIEFGYDPKHKILDKISMKFETDEIVGLIGPSGCGKSTFSKILAGYLRAQGGARCCLTARRSLSRDIAPCS